MRKLPHTIVGLLICFYFIFTLFLSSCVPEQVTEVTEKPAFTAPLPTSTKEDIEELTPLPTLVENIPTEVVTNPAITEVLTEEVPTETPELIVEDIPYVSTEKNEAFDMESINILEWEDFTLEKDVILEESETVTTAEGSQLYLMPVLGGGGTSNVNITKLEVPSGFDFNIKQKKIISNSEGESVTLGIVENTFENWSANSSLILLLSGMDDKGCMQGFVEKQEIRYPSVSFVNSLEAIAPLEVEVKSLLTSLLKISSFQEEERGIPTNKEISLKEVLEPVSLLPYNSTLEYFSGTDYVASALKLLSNKEGVLTVINLDEDAGKGRIFPGPFTVKDFGWTTGLGKKGDFVSIFNNTKGVNTKYFIEIEPIFSNIDNTRRSIIPSGASKIIYGATISLIEYSLEEEEEMRLRMQEQVEELQTLYDNYLLYLKENSGDIAMDDTLIPMEIPRKTYAKRYFLSDNALYNLVGHEKPLPFISDEEYFNWYFKENPKK